MPAAFAAQFKLPRALGIENHHGFDAHQAIFGAAEGEHVDTRFPRHLRRGGPCCDDRIGKACPIEMTGDTVLLRKSGQSRNFERLIDRALFGAFVAELLRDRKDYRKAIKSAFGSLVGFLMGTGLKLFACVLMAYYFVLALV